MGLRLLDVENKVWSDFWVNSKSGVLVSPGTTGHFVDGAGIFLAGGTTGPATAMVEVPRLIDPQMLVEIEADAYVGS